jgi:hypothetical protein
MSCRHSTIARPTFAPALRASGLALLAAFVLAALPHSRASASCGDYLDGQFHGGFQSGDSRDGRFDGRFDGQFDGQQRDGDLPERDQGPTSPATPICDGPACRQEPAAPAAPPAPTNDRQQDERLVSFDRRIQLATPSPASCGFDDESLPGNPSGMEILRPPRD